ncbi:MAG: extracellular solute-binding protein [Solirubrobacteraceae bacterium]
MHDQQPGHDRSPDISRRALLKRAGVGAGALAAGPLLLSACGDDEKTTSTAAPGASGESAELKALLDAVESKRVIIANYGGTTEAAREKAFWEPFTERTGVRVVGTDLPGNMGDDQLSGKIPVKWDAYHGSPGQMLAATKVSGKEAPRVPDFAQEDLLPEEFRPYFFQTFFVGYVPAMLPGTFSGEQPKTWADFFDTKKFPGKRAWPGAEYRNVGTFEAALMADGVAPDELYPLDLERAAAKMKPLIKDALIYQQFPQAQSFLTSKSVSMSFAGNGLWKGLQDKGVKLEILWDMAPIVQPNGMSILPDSPNADAVQALAGFCAQPERQAEFARLTSYGPPSEAAFEVLTEAETAELPNAPGRAHAVADEKYYGENDPLLADWNKKIFS